MSITGAALLTRTRTSPGNTTVAGIIRLPSHEIIIAAAPTREVPPAHRPAIVPSHQRVTDRAEDSPASAIVPRQVRPASGAVPVGEVTEAVEAVAEVAEADVVVVAAKLFCPLIIFGELA
jgi:hypothetical protein